MPDGFAISMRPEFFVPFLFVFAIVFGLLEFVPVKFSRAVKAVVALAIAFFAASYGPFVASLWRIMPTAIWGFVIIFFIGFVIEMMRKVTAGEETMKIIITGIALIVFISIGIQYVPNVPFIGLQNFLMLLALLFMGMMFYAAFREREKPVPKEGG